MTMDTFNRSNLKTLRREIEAAPLAEIDYVELCDPDSLEAAPAHLVGPALLALAVSFPAAAGGADRVRLIDNRVLQPVDDVD